MGLLRTIAHRLRCGARTDSEIYLDRLRRLGMKIGENTVVFDPGTVSLDETRPWMIEIGDNVHAVVGGEHNDGIVRDAQIFEFIENDADGSVHVCDGAVVLCADVFGIGAFRREPGAEIIAVEQEISVIGSSVRSVALCASENLKVLIKKGEGENVTLELSLPEKLQAPLRKGETVGKAVARRGGETVANAPISLCESLPERGFYTSIQEILDGWVRRKNA